MISRFLNTQHLLPAFWLALIASLSITNAVRAQFGEAAGIAEAMTPDVMSRDIVMFSKGLDLDETQRVIVEALFNDYNDEFEAGVERMKSRFEEMRKDLVQEDSRRVLALVFMPFAELGQEKAKNFERFINNVKVILTPEQMIKWPAFERQLLREKEMNKGRLSGESIDLIKVLRDLHLDDAVVIAAQPVVEQYDLELDQVLRNRKAMRAKIQPDMLRAMSEQDGKTSMDLFEKMIAKQVAVRDVNDKHLELIVVALPAEDGQKFLQSALERAYPRVYRQTPGERLFADAIELEGLSPETLKAVRELQYNFLVELAPMNAGLLREIRQWDPVEQRQHAANFASHWQGATPERKEDPTRDSFLKRDELTKRYAKSLQAVLTPEQFGQLPGSYRWLSDENAAKPLERNLKPEVSNLIGAGGKFNTDSSQSGATDGGGKEN